MTIDTDQKWKAVIFKSPFFGVNLVVGCVDCDTIAAADYWSVCCWVMLSVAEWDQNINGLGGRSTWYCAERCTNRTDPSPISSNQGHMRVVSGILVLIREPMMPRELIAPTIAPMAVIRLSPLAILSWAAPSLRWAAWWSSSPRISPITAWNPVHSPRGLSFAGCWLCWGVRLLPGGHADDPAFCLTLDVAKRLPPGRLLSD